MKILILFQLILLSLYASHVHSSSFNFTQDRQVVVLLDLTASIKVDKNTFAVKDVNATCGTIKKVDNITQIQFDLIWTSPNATFSLYFNYSTQQVFYNATFLYDTKIYSLNKFINALGSNPVRIDRNISYTCVTPLDYQSDGNTISVSWSNFKFELYPSLNNSMFDSPHSCKMDFDDKIVPIAVGAALGLLLILVVVIYVISYIRERRTQNKELRHGYNRLEGQPEPNHHS